MSIYSSQIAVKIRSPYRTKNLFTVHDRSGMGSKKVKDLNFLRRKGNDSGINFNRIILDIDLKSVES